MFRVDAVAAIRPKRGRKVAPVILRESMRQPLYLPSGRTEPIPPLPAAPDQLVALAEVLMELRA